MQHQPITWTVGPLSQSEHAQIHVLYDEAFPGMDSVLDSLGDHAEVLSAHDEGELVGYLVATQSGTDRVELWEHVVAHGHRGRGVGRDLLTHLINHLPGEDLVVVDPAGLLDGQRLADYYGHAGFRVAPSGEMQARVTEIGEALSRV